MRILNKIDWQFPLKFQFQLLGILSIIVYWGCESNTPVRKDNLHRELKIGKAMDWINMVRPYPGIKNLEGGEGSIRSDHFVFNDSGMFIGSNKLELANYHSHNTFGKRYEIPPDTLKLIVEEFTELGLNRYFRFENHYIFLTEVYYQSRKGYCYLDMKNSYEVGDRINWTILPDELKTSLPQLPEITAKYSPNWFEWRES
ncbi:MAG: hypothetical protein H6581_16355 [Bacteroidia bacterium]|nr:hypothetical protein [Bacteroidia bacterium]